MKLSGLQHTSLSSQHYFIFKSRRKWRTLSLMIQNNLLDCFSCKELKNKMYHHEKSASRSIEITVRSDSIRHNMILIVKNVPSSALSSKASNRKQIGIKYLQQPVGNGVCFFFFFYAWSHWFVWLKLLLWSQWSCDSTYGESKDTCTKGSSGLTLLCEIEL